MAGENNPLSYAFWAGTPSNSPLSYDALQTRRKIAEQLMGKRSPFPKTFGEGLTYAGERFADVMDMNRLDAAEKQQAAYEANVLRGGPPLPGSENTAVAPAGPAAASRPVSDAGTDTTAPVQTAAAPYSAPGAAPGNVPLPPPRPARLRDTQLAELQDNPALLRKAAAMTLGEVDRGTSPAERQTQFASVLDRAGARGIPVAQALETYTGPGSRGYYPPDAFARGERLLQKPGAMEAFERDIATPVLRGADPGAAALGFTPTGNASGGVAQRGVASGRYNVAGQFPGSAETYVQQESPAQLARLEAGRNRIAAAASQPVQTASLTTPRVASDAGPASAIADSASTAIAALPTQAQQPAQTPPLIPGGPPTPSPIPLAPAEVRTPGVQTAQAPALRPSQEPIPPGSLPDIPPLQEVPTRPLPLGPRAEERHWQGVMNNPQISDRGRAYAAQQLSAWQEHRKELDKQQQEDFTHKRGTAEAANLLRDKIIRDMPKDQQEELVRRLNIEKMQATNPFEARQAEANLNNTLATIEKSKQEIAAGKAPEHIKFENGKVGQWDQKTGTYKDITPQINPFDIQLKEGEGKKLEFYVRARGASDQLGNDAKSLTNLGSALATRTRSVLGNYAVNPQYQKEYTLAKMWGQAVLRDESGAALPDKEVENKMTTYWPVPADTPETIAAKAQARRREETSFYLALGGARPLADFYVERQTTQPEGTVLKDPTGKVRRTVKNGLWMDAPDAK